MSSKASNELKMAGRHPKSWTMMNRWSCTSGSVGSIHGQRPSHHHDTCASSARKVKLGHARNAMYTMGRTIQIRASKIVCRVFDVVTCLDEARSSRRATQRNAPGTATIPPKITSVTAREFMSERTILCIMSGLTDIAPDGGMYVDISRPENRICSLDNITGDKPYKYRYRGD